MRYVIFTILLVVPLLLTAQSKKEQIAILNLRVDSLSEVLVNMRVNNAQKLSDKSDKIFQLSQEKGGIEKEKLELESECDSIFEKLSSTIETQTNDIDVLTQKLIEVEFYLDEFERPKKQLIESYARILDSIISYNNTPDDWETVQLYGETWRVDPLIKFTFNNGDSILIVYSLIDWELCLKNHVPCCMWNTIQFSGIRMSSLMYNVYAVRDERGLLPSGWILPEYSRSWADNWASDYLGYHDNYERYIRPKLDLVNLLTSSLPSGGIGSDGTVAAIMGVGSFEMFWNKDSGMTQISIQHIETRNEYLQVSNAGKGKQLGAIIRIVKDD